MKYSFPPNGVMPAVADITVDSPNCVWHRTGGYQSYNSKRINPGAATTSTNLFQVTGLVEIKALYGEFTDVTNVVGGPTACSFDLYDGAATVQLTAAAGVSCATAVAGSVITKDQLVANNLTFLNASQCRMEEPGAGPGGNRPFQDFAVLQKTGANTYIRFTCTTLAANDFTVNFCVVWACRYPGSNLVAV